MATDLAPPAPTIVGAHLAQWAVVALCRCDFNIVARGQQHLYGWQACWATS